MKNKIAFICDREKHCRISKGCGKECKRTADPEHAINFSKLDDDCYIEREEPCGENVVTAWMELPKPYIGKWIDVVNSHCTCPICGSEWSYFDNETERFNYCPNCGAEIHEG